MGKNIIICCDGTGNQFGEENSNVVKLHSIIIKNKEQITYYDPGVGTLSEKGIKSTFRKKISKYSGMAFGLGLKRNVEEAYRFLMDNYDEGDNIYLFGFSRGAYTVRVLAALIYKCGLLRKGNYSLFEYAYIMFEDPKDTISPRFKTEYSLDVPIHFLGAWDTVSSYGWIGKLKSFPYTANNPTLVHIRHAVAIDERRTYYRQNLFHRKEDDSRLLEVWFAGVHSDIGGSYKEEESGLSKIALKWMLVEAEKKGLKIDLEKYKEIALGEGGSYVPPNPGAKLHKSLKGFFWWALELVPRRIYNPTKERKVWKLPFGRSRTIVENSNIHYTVVERMDMKELHYAPRNLLKNKHWNVISEGDMPQK